MIHLLEAIYTKISAQSARTYLEKVPELDPITELPPTFPYAVYKLPSSFDQSGYKSGNREDYILEIDIWDNIQDTTRLEALTDAIDEALHRTRILNSNVSTNIYRISRMMIPDTDETICRRELRYVLQTYFIVS